MRTLFIAGLMSLFIGAGVLPVFAAAAAGVPPASHPLQGGIALAPKARLSVICAQAKDLRDQLAWQKLPPRIQNTLTRIEALACV